MKIIALAIISFVITSCSSSDVNNNNPYLPNYSFSVSVNLSLPAYSKLNYVSNAVFFSGAGIKGIYIFNTGSGFAAYDAACPNQSLADCSTLTLKGVNVVCPCDTQEYSLFTGQGTQKYPLKQYRVEATNGVLRVYN